METIGIIICCFIFSMILLYKRQRIKSLKRSVEFLSGDLSSITSELIELKKKLEYQKQEISVLTYFAGESLHHRIVCYSNLGRKEKREDTKEVSWLIKVTSTLRMSSSKERLHELLKNDTLFKSENDILLNEVKDAQQRINKNSTLGFIAISLGNRIDKIIRNDDEKNKKKSC